MGDGIKWNENIWCKRSIIACINPRMMLKKYERKAWTGCPKNLSEITSFKNLGYVIYRVMLSTSHCEQKPLNNAIIYYKKPHWFKQ